MQRKLACWQRGLAQHRKELALLLRALPKDVLAAPRQRLDVLGERLPRALNANAQLHRTHLTRVAAMLSPRLLRLRLVRGQEIADALSARAHRAERVMRERRAQRLRSAGQLLGAFSYRGVLARGFALVRDGGGKPLRGAGSVGAGMALEIEFSDGRVRATAGGGGERSAAPAPRAKPAKGPGGQGNLF
jgi:exodeoxyribonuclease VII large subunit